MLPRLVLALAALALATPGAAAWAFDVAHPVGGDLVLRESLLLSGRIEAEGVAAAFGALEVHGLDLGVGLVVEHCPDRADTSGPGLPTGGCAGGETFENATVRIAHGGILARPSAEAIVRLAVASGVAALGGRNVSLAGGTLGDAVFAAGHGAVASTGDAFVLRPVGREPSIIVASGGEERVYNGSAFSLRISGAQGATLRAPALLAGPVAHVNVTRAGAAQAEAALGVEDLFRLMRGVTPDDRADRRADLATAFGPFQVVPSLLDGALAAQQGLRLDGAAEEGFVLLRLGDARLVVEGGNWTGAGNATYVYRDGALVTRAGDAAGVPLVLPGILLAGAVALRWRAGRETPRLGRRVLGRVMGVLVALLLLLLALRLVQPLLGVDMLQDWALLSLRTRVQLLLLAGGMAGLAWLLAGLPLASIARSLLRWRGRPHAVVPAALAGFVGGALLLAWRWEALLVLVARLVRL